MEKWALHHSFSRWNVMFRGLIVVVVFTTTWITGKGNPGRTKARKMYFEKLNITITITITRVVVWTVTSSLNWTTIWLTTLLLHSSNLRKLIILQTSCFSFASNVCICLFSSFLFEIGKRKSKSKSCKNERKHFCWIKTLAFYFTVCWIQERERD